MHAGDAVLEGIRACGQADWDSARSAFEAALQDADTPEAHEGLGLALWFLGRVPDAIAARGRAFEGYLASGRCDDAARLGVWLSHQHLLAGRSSAARGWLARAERSLGSAGASGRGRGWVTVERARQAPGAQEQGRLARQAMELARTSGDRDLEVFALSLLGRAVVAAGRQEDGLRLLEETMAAASGSTSGPHVGNVHTLAEAYCNLIEGCRTAGEWARAAEWCELVEDFARCHSAAPLFGACRAIHADVLLATGQWPQAEQALETAIATHADHVPQLGAPAVATLAELRVRQGRLLDAEQLLSGRQEEPTALRALALLRLAEGRPQEAAALLERGLRGAGDHAVRAALLLAPLSTPDSGAGTAMGRRSQPSNWLPSPARPAFAWFSRMRSWSPLAWRSTQIGSARPPSLLAEPWRRSAAWVCPSTPHTRGSPSPARWPLRPPSSPRTRRALRWQPSGCSGPGLPRAPPAPCCAT